MHLHTVLHVLGRLLVLLAIVLLFPLGTAVVFGDGHQALEFVSAGEEPEVIVLDLRMPGLDGLEVLRRIRRDHPSIQVIVVTGHGDEEDEREVRRLGAFDYLQKPVAINKLAERINAASEKAKAESDTDEAE